MNADFWTQAEKRMDENRALLQPTDWKRSMSLPFIFAGLQFWKIGLLISGIISLVLFTLFFEIFILLGKGLLLL